ncbi:MAG: hypothetical protein IPO62_03115 [Saprospiraceae bacterium]|nr:hypothetical protein [Saprospiraceae bacterium]MBK9630052.1 hypothetical protein [Saprospiraceae bacterium]
MSNSQKTKSTVDHMIDTQGAIVDKAVEVTKKLSANVPMVNETLDKGQELFHKAVQSQKELTDKTTENINKINQNMNNSAEMAQNFFKQWLENQMTMAKSTFGQLNTNGTTTPNPTDMMASWQNWMDQAKNQWSSMMNQNAMMSMMNQNPFMSMMQSNPFIAQNGTQNQMNEGIQQWSKMTKQYLDSMNQSYGDWVKQFSNMTSADTFKGMTNMSENMGKFFELWMPMFKSMNDKTFSAEKFMEALSPEKYKAFVDGFFKFMPEGSQKMMEQMNAQFVQFMKEISLNGLSNYSNMKNQFQQIPGMNHNPYSNAWEMYHNWRTSMNEAVSPLTKLMNQNGPVKSAQVWNEIYELMIEFNLKNNELQYMVYQHGLKAMDKLADKVASQIGEGKSIDSFVKLYQDWLVTGDEVFTDLFNSDAYSKSMTEVSSLQMRLKKDIDDQMESMFLVNMPVATRTEMDEVYKSIYDLKKMYRNLEKVWAGMEESKKSEPKQEAPKATAAKKK